MVDEAFDFAIVRGRCGHLIDAIGEYTTKVRRGAGRFGTARRDDAQKNYDRARASRHTT